MRVNILFHTSGAKKKQPKTKKNAVESGRTKNKLFCTHENINIAIVSNHRRANNRKIGHNSVQI